MHTNRMFRSNTHINKKIKQTKELEDAFDLALKIIPKDTNQLSFNPYFDMSEYNINHLIDIYTAVVRSKAPTVDHISGGKSTGIISSKKGLTITSIRGVHPSLPDARLIITKH